MEHSELKSGLHKLIDELTDESVLRSVYVLLSASKLNQDKDWLEALPANIQEHLIHGILQSEGIAPDDREEVLKQLAEKHPELKLK